MSSLVNSLSNNLSIIRMENGQQSCERTDRILTLKEPIFPQVEDDDDDGTDGMWHEESHLRLKRPKSSHTLMMVIIPD